MKGQMREWLTFFFLGLLFLFCLLILPSPCPQARPLVCLRANARDKRDKSDLSTLTEIGQVAWNTERFVFVFLLVL